MTVVPLAALPSNATETGEGVAIAHPASGARDFAGALFDAIDGAGAALDAAGRSEAAFLHGRGGLQEMVLDRASADIALALATTAASRATQSLSTIFGMQI